MKIATWNVRTMHQPRNLENIKQEGVCLKVVIMGSAIYNMEDRYAKFRDALRVGTVSIAKGGEDWQTEMDDCYDTTEDRPEATC